MPSKTFFALFTLALTASTFTIPEGQPDGVYVYSNSSGTANHTLISDAPSFLRARGTKPPPPGPKGQGPTALNPDRQGCMKDGIVPLADIIIAAHALNSSCAPAKYQVVHAGKHLYATAGGAVAYMCNFGEDNPCAADEFTDAFGRIGDSCGNATANATAGWAMRSDWRKSYGYDFATAKICAGG